MDLSDASSAGRACASRAPIAVVTGDDAPLVKQAGVKISDMPRQARVERQIEHGLAPRAAAIEAMKQVSGPVVAVGVVLSAVFVPCAFISGITGQFFRQFALTIAVSTIISAFNSLTLSPALTALFLKPLPANDKVTGRQGDKVNKAPPLPRLAFALQAHDQR